MKWQLSKLLWLFVFMLFSLLLPSLGLSWTRNEWVGIIEAVAAIPQHEDVDNIIGDDCPNCEGTGKVGDGVVFVECGECEGTGKRKKTEEESQEQKEEPAVNPATSFREG